MTTVALVPAFRRADRVGATVAALAALVDEVVVVDDGSGDGGATVEAARRAGATVIALPGNRGKGGALAAGIAATPQASRYLLVDADTAATAAATAPLLDALDRGADLSIGVLPPAEGRGGFGTVRAVAAWGIRRACGFEAAAPLSGQRAVRAPLLRSLELADRFGVEVGMTVDAVRSGASVVEVPVDVDHDHTGRGVAGFAHRGAQGLDLLRALWPRLADEGARVAFLVGLAVAAAAVLAGTAVASTPTGTPIGPVDRVVLVATAPSLRLGDLDDAHRPVLAALAGQRGAVAAANVDVPEDSPWSTWATVGAGRKLRARPPTREPDPSFPFRVQDLQDGQGLLGDALRRAGRATSFIGVQPTSAVRLAVADGSGVTDRSATAGALGVAGMVNRSRDDLAAGVSLLAVDAGSLDAAGLDDLLAGLHPDDGERRLILLVTPAEPGGVLGLRPLVASGPGAPAGRLLSPSTRRNGLVLLTDVAPTILSALEVPVPDEMTGRPLRRLAGDPDVPGLVAADRLSRQRNTVWDPALLAVVPLHFASYLWAWRRRHRSTPAAAAAHGPEGPRAEAVAGGALPVSGAPVAARPRWRRRAPAGAEAAEPVAGGGPPGVGLAPSGPAGAGPDPAPASTGTGEAGAGTTRSLAERSLIGVGMSLVAWPLATWLVRAAPGAASLGRGAALAAVVVDLLVVAAAQRLGRRGLAPLAIVLAATVTLVTIDLGFGGHLQVSSAFGGAAHSTGRFTGLGNAAFAVYAASALMAVHCARRRAPWMVALLVLVALVDALPPLGGDVGGAVTLTPIFALTLAALWDRLSWRAVAAAAAAVVAVVGLALAVDLSRPDDARSHLGRFVSGGGRSSSIGGKVTQNLETYVAVPALAVVVAITATFAVLLWRGRFRRALPPGTPARIAVAAALAVALVGNLLNDSGPIVTLLAMSIISPALVVRSAAGDPPPRVLPPIRS